jgi:hypothetical protein
MGVFSQREAGGGLNFCAVYAELRINGYAELYTTDIMAYWLPLLHGGLLSSRNQISPIP